MRKLRTNAFSEGIFKTVMQMWNVCFSNAYIFILYGVHRMPFRLQCTSHTQFLTQDNFFPQMFASKERFNNLDKGTPLK